MDTQIDPQVKNLVSAIGRAETGDPSPEAYTKKGASGEFGRYQFMPDTYKNYAQKYLGDSNAEPTIENQNKIIYSFVKEKKDAGYNPAQIASMWNAGEAKPNAYKENYKGINEQGVAYNTPAYVQKVSDYYNQSKEQSITQQKERGRGFFGDIAHSIVEPVATMLARPIQAGAELLGASAEDVNKATQNIAGDWVAPVPQSGTDVVKDIGRAAQTVALGMPIGGIGQAVKSGVIAGAGAGAEQTGTVGGVLKGGAMGGGLGLAGGLVSKALTALPKSLTSSAFKDLNPAQVEKVLNEKTVGSKASLLAQSQKAVKNYTTQIDDILTKTEARGSGNDALRATVLDFPEYNSDKGVEKMLTKIKSLIPSGTTEGRGTILSYIDKIANGTATLYEKNKVRSAIDSATSGGWAKMAKNLNPSAGHDLAITFANSLRGEVKNWVPETIPMFEEFAKEVGIQKALAKLAGKQPEALVGYKDLLPYLGGNALGGAPAGMTAAAIEKAGRSPVVKFGAAKGIKPLGKVIKPATSRAGLLAPSIQQQ